jgi:hypothetical protein
MKENSDAPNFYTLEPSVVYNDLFPLDFEDILHQAFEKDRLESFTIKLSKRSERIKMQVITIHGIRFALEFFRKDSSGNKLGRHIFFTN